MVVGSESPWLETLCLMEGAEMVHTLEYGYIRTKHPKMRAFMPPLFGLKMLRFADIWNDGLLI